MVDISIFNRIAQNQKLLTPLGNYIFNLKSNDELNEFIDTYYKILCLEGFNNSVASAVLELLPLVLENIAISNYIYDINNLDMRSILPEILNANEALHYAKGDNMSIMYDSKLQEQFLFLMNSKIKQQDFLTTGNNE